MCSFVLVARDGPVNFAIFLGPVAVFFAVVAPFFSDEGAALRSTSPLASYRGDAVRVCVLTSIVALAVGASVFASYALEATEDTDYVEVVMFALLSGPFAATIVGLAVGQAQTAFLLAKALSAVRRRLPLRLMRFLDQAHRMGLLRVVGSAYQFRHAELQDHLAARSDGVGRRHA